MSEINGYIYLLYPGMKSVKNLKAVSDINILFTVYYTGKKVFSCIKSVIYANLS
jgi:hypothetical protein